MPKIARDGGMTHAASGHLPEVVLPVARLHVVVGKGVVPRIDASGEDAPKQGCDEVAEDVRLARRHGARQQGTRRTMINKGNDIN